MRIYIPDHLCEMNILLLRYNVRKYQSYIFQSLSERKINQLAYMQACHVNKKISDMYHNTPNITINSLTFKFAIGYASQSSSTIFGTRVKLCVRPFLIAGVRTSLNCWKASFKFAICFFFFCRGLLKAFGGQQGQPNNPSST